MTAEEDVLSAKRAIVVTTINPPTKAVQAISEIPGWELIVVGDTKTPEGWSWPNVTFLSLESQLAGGGAFAEVCPVGHYARKNVGYLHAIAGGATIIAETDDDNLPYPSFPGDGELCVHGVTVGTDGWENVYRYFSADAVWPRGFPLECIRPGFEKVLHAGDDAVVDCAIQQYLADGDPDVDAVYRLTVGREHTFSGDPVILARSALCPFNSQNTVWWPQAFPLLYLPAYASFRMTDIWRSFVAQVCLHAAGGRIAFRAPTVYQERNAHSLLHDFELEVPGYLHNDRIARLLRGLPLSSAPLDVASNLRSCYEALVASGFLPEVELDLVDRWIAALP